MRVFCFNKVIYDGYLTIDLFFFILRQHFLRIFQFFKLIPKTFRFLLKQIDSTTLMASFYEVVLENISVSELNLFKSDNMHKIDLTGFGIEKDDKNDIIVTGEPSFLIDLFINRNKYNVICSEYNLQTRRFSGKICVDKRKVERLAELGITTIKQLFIFSFKDRSLMSHSDYIFVYRGHEIIDYDAYQGTLLDKIQYNIANKKLIGYTFVATLLLVITIIFTSMFAVFFNPIICFLVGYLLWIFASYYSIVTFVNETAFTTKYLGKYVLGVLPNFLIQFLLVIIFIGYLGFIPWIVYLITALITVPSLLFIIIFYKFD